jgi:uncharacterized cofD-like protein
MPEPKKITIIGGGHGSSVILSGLRDRDVDLSAVISMADDGGSTGRLRRELGASAVGDIRNCLAALCDSAELSELFSYRFAKGELEGHALGNLFLAAGELTFGNIQESIDYAREALGVKAKIYPATLDNTQLKYTSEDQEVIGMHEIAKLKLKPSPSLTLEPDAKLAGQAEKAILDANLVIIAPGNFYCSIAQALLAGGMAETLEKSTAKVAIVINLVNIDRHCPGYNPQDYLNEVNRLLGREVIDYVIYNSEKIDENLLKAGESQVKLEFEQPAAGKTLYKAGKLVDKQIATPDPNDKIAYIRSNIRHDKNRLAEILLAL